MLKKLLFLLVLINFNIDKIYSSNNLFKSYIFAFIATTAGSFDALCSFPKKRSYPFLLGGIALQFYTGYRYSNSIEKANLLTGMTTFAALSISSSLTIGGSILHSILYSILEKEFRGRTLYSILHSILQEKFRGSLLHSILEKKFRGRTLYSILQKKYLDIFSNKENIGRSLFTAIISMFAFCSLCSYTIKKALIGD